MIDATPYKFWGIFSQLKEMNIFDTPPGDLYGPDLADFYDRFVGEFSSDIPIFQRLLVSGARVLDLACGAGRIGIPLARMGFQVDGIDLSHEMLALAEQKAGEETPQVQGRLSFRQGDMTSFVLPDRYDLIMVGVTSISLLLDRPSRERLFSCVAKHLAPEGHFVFDILDLSGERWRDMHNYYDTWSVETDEGTDFAIVGQRFFPDARLFSLNVFREKIGWDGETKRYIGNSVKAWLDDDQLREELDNSGLNVVEQFDENQTKYFVAKARSKTT